MLRKLISDVTNINLYVADAIFKYYDGLSERPLENILIGRPEASNSEYIPTWKIGYLENRLGRVVRTTLTV